MVNGYGLDLVVGCWKSIDCLAYWKIFERYMPYASAGDIV